MSHKNNNSRTFNETQELRDLRTHEEPVEDRSMFNCMDCKGQGLDGNVRCDSCLGTGKV